MSATAPTSLPPVALKPPLGDCNMVCSGDQYEYCGAGNRLELYSTTATRTTSSTPAPTATLGVKSKVGKYTFQDASPKAPATGLWLALRPLTMA